MHVKKHLGDIAVTQVIAKIVKLGGNVSIPVHDHLSYDLIVEIGGICYKVQVKHAPLRQGKLRPSLRTVYKTTGGKNVIKTRKPGDYDWLAVYNEDIGCVLFLDMKEIKQTTLISIDPYMESKLPMVVVLPAKE